AIVKGGIAYPLTAARPPVVEVMESRVADLLACARKAGGIRVVKNGPPDSLAGYLRPVVKMRERGAADLLAGPAEAIVEMVKRGIPNPLAGPRKAVGAAMKGGVSDLLAGALGKGRGAEDE